MGEPASFLTAQAAGLWPVTPPWGLGDLFWHMNHSKQQMIPKLLLWLMYVSRYMQTELLRVSWLLALKYIHINCPRILLLRLLENNFFLKTCIPTPVLSPKILISRAPLPFLQGKRNRTGSRDMLWWSSDDTYVFFLFTVIFNRRLVVRGATELSLWLRDWLEV